ncbi:MAG: hypothetical protein GDA50_04120 [Alphaproteobacteria bacterium GM202ARS2]|nr:hypothetical protein [Alphaproteobacteria bacterium GM202ARS2]
MRSRNKLLADIEAFLRKTGMTPTAFGKQAVGDRDLVFTLREGRSLTLDLADRVIDFMAEYQGQPRPDVPLVASLGTESKVNERAPII